MQGKTETWRFAVLKDFTERLNDITDVSRDAKPSRSDSSILKVPEAVIGVKSDGGVLDESPNRRTVRWVILG